MVENSTLQVEDPGNSLDRHAENEPDFETYTLDELLDVREHLDRHRFPDRSEVVDRLIAERSAAGERNVKSVPSVSRRDRILLIVVGGLVTVTLWYFRGPVAGSLSALALAVGIGFEFFVWSNLDSHRGG